MGFSGGLKAIEHSLGLDRGDLASVDGLFAVRLWQEYQRRKNERALETLLAYNCADVINLEFLLVYVFNKHLESTPFLKQHKLENPIALKIPFQADRELINRLSF